MVGTQDSVLSVRIAAAWALAAGADAVKLAWASGQLSRHDLDSAGSCIAQGVPVSLQLQASPLRTHWPRTVHALHAAIRQGVKSGTSRYAFACLFTSILWESEGAVGCSMLGPGAGL